MGSTKKNCHSWRYYWHSITHTPLPRHGMSSLMRDSTIPLLPIPVPPTTKLAMLCGCVTFGTPHEGAALAEIPSEQFIAEIVRVKTINNTGNIAYLRDIFRYQKQRKGFPGIQDLRPVAGTSGNFLRTLRQKERSQTQIPKQRLLDIFAIGGHVAQQDMALVDCSSFFWSTIHNSLKDKVRTIHALLILLCFSP
jgi:hypothetical protein